MITTTLDGRPVRLIPQEGPPTEPGLYLAEYTPLHGMRHTVARDVFRHCAGAMILGPDETRLEWWARIFFDASAGSTAGVTLGGGLIRGGATDGEATNQRGDGAGSAEPSTPGREVATPVEVEERDGVVIFKRNGLGFAEYSRATMTWSLLPHGTAEALLAWRAERDTLRARVAEMDDANQERVEAESVACTLRARVADLERQLDECNRMRVDALHRATAGEQAAVMASEGRKSAEAAFNRVCERAEQAEAELTDVRKALKAPDWYDLTAWAELVVLKREQAEARVAELEAERRWVPVDDGLPDEGTSVLAWDRRKGTRGMFHAGDGVFYHGDGGDVTHWRPLPAGPEVKP